MSNNCSTLEIGNFFGLNDTAARLLKIITESGPLIQTELRNKYSELMQNVDEDKKQKGERPSSKGAKSTISKECKRLVNDKELFNEFELAKKRRKIKYDLNENKLEWVRKSTRLLEFTRLQNILNNIPSDLEPEKPEGEDFFKKEKRLYNQGKWEEARISLLKYKKEDLSLRKETLRQRLLGWCSYYLGKKKILKPGVIGNQARNAFIRVLQDGKIQEDIDSALNGLPLVYYFLLNQPDKAFKIMEEAEKIAHNKAQVYNTKGILKREQKLYLEAYGAFSKSFQEAKELEDYRTCGNAANNIARISMDLLFNLSKLNLDNELLFDKYLLRKFKENAESQFKKAKE